jgi:hypothetical protein
VANCFRNANSFSADSVTFVGARLMGGIDINGGAANQFVRSTRSRRLLEKPMGKEMVDFVFIAS